MKIILKKILGFIKICFWFSLLFAVIMVSMPFSRVYMGKTIKINMSVKVNGEYVKPENITCTRSAHEETQKISVVSKSKSDVLYIDSVAKSRYYISYDVNTPDGVKHFTYSVFKTHDMGPREEYFYRNDLYKDEATGEWYANVWLDNKNAEAGATTIWLNENEDADVHYGP